VKSVARGLGRQRGTQAEIGGQASGGSVRQFLTHDSEVEVALTRSIWKYSSGVVGRLSLSHGAHVKGHQTLAYGPEMRPL
jgi:hypothetical protein